MMVIIFLSISMLLLLARAMLGPSIFDRLLAANIFTTNIVVLIAVLAFAKDSPSYIDVALVYVFLNFTATIGFLRFFKYGTFKGSNVGKKKKAHKAKAEEVTKAPKITKKAKAPKKKAVKKSIKTPIKNPVKKAKAPKKKMVRKPVKKAKKTS